MDCEGYFRDSEAPTRRVLVLLEGEGLQGQFDSFHRMDTTTLCVRTHGNMTLLTYYLTYLPT